MAHLPLLCASLKNILSTEIRFGEVTGAGNLAPHPIMLGTEMIGLEGMRVGVSGGEVKHVITPSGNVQAL